MAVTALSRLGLGTPRIAPSLACHPDEVINTPFPNPALPAALVRATATRPVATTD